MSTEAELRAALAQIDTVLAPLRALVERLECDRALAYARLHWWTDAVAWASFDEARVEDVARLIWLGDDGSTADNVIAACEARAPHLAPALRREIAKRKEAGT